jgi:hypothetical protein
VLSTWEVKLSTYKIISGGQTGADTAALVAATRVGVATGGVMPKGFITLDGKKPEYEQLYGVTQSESGKYPPRTTENVKAADITLRFAKDFKSRGEVCTMNAILRFNKPFVDIRIPDTKLPIDDLPLVDQPESIAEFIIGKEFFVINVAGNSERSCPGIQKFVEGYIERLLKALLERSRLHNGVEPITPEVSSTAQ